jgi:hypothetical protein
MFKTSSMRKTFVSTFSLGKKREQTCYLNIFQKLNTTHSTLKSVPTLSRYRQIEVTVWQIPDAVDTVVCAPDDGWKYHPKHVEQFPDENKLCNVASCWMYEYTGTLLGSHPILGISRIRVNNARTVQFCCTLPAVGKPVAVNKYHISRVSMSVTNGTDWTITNVAVGCNRETPFAASTYEIPVIKIQRKTK